MNWNRLECDGCGYSDYDDSHGTVEQTDDGMYCADCRVDQMLEWNDEGGYYE